MPKSKKKSKTRKRRSTKRLFIKKEHVSPQEGGVGELRLGDRRRERPRKRPKKKQRKGYPGKETQ
jgi:hypothetical protein